VERSDTRGSPHRELRTPEACEDYLGPLVIDCRYSKTMSDFCKRLNWLRDRL
jgi:hypothetical protein